ncbi:MAG: polyprenol monophosphomannose synthase, partial [Acidobacteriota bacterium]
MLFTLPTPDLFVLIVDDNSPDGTAEVVKNLQSQYPNLHIEIRQTKEGLGPAYIHGFTYALKHGATEVVHMDADLSHDPADVPKLLAELRDHDVVIGSRYCHGISVINWPLKRLLISLMGNTYARFITGLPVKDATGGFKAWKEQTLRDIAYTTVSTDGYGFHIVTTYRAWKKGKKIMEVPIIFT